MGIGVLIKISLNFEPLKNKSKNDLLITIMLFVNDYPISNKDQCSKRNIGCFPSTKHSINHFQISNEKFFDKFNKLLLNLFPLYHRFHRLHLVILLYLLLLLQFLFSLVSLLFILLQQYS